MNLRLLSALSLSTLTLLFSGCALNPATGNNDFSIISEAREIAIGREQHKRILGSFPIYKDQELQDYVQDVGETLAANSHRNDLVYRFTIIDSPDINAFALPGGYIYMNRGLMTYLNSEAELAGVLAHEIGHVTARHSARQQSMATVAGVLTQLIGVYTGNRQIAQLSNVVGQLLIRGYGRDMELEADSFGAEYLVNTGYDPQAMIEVIGVLKDQEEFSKQLAEETGQQFRNYHGLFSTHPRNDTRLQEVISKAEALSFSEKRDVNRQEFLNKLKGMTFGDSKESGVRRGQGFYHASLGIAMTFPDGWSIQNGSQAVIAFPKTGGTDKAYVVMQVDDINKRISPRQFMIDRLVGAVPLDQEQKLDLNGLKGHTAVIRGLKNYSRDGRQDIPTQRIAVIYVNDQAYIIVGRVNDDNDLAEFDPYFMETIDSFRRLSEEEKPLAEGLKIEIVQVDEDTTFDQLAIQSKIPNYPKEQLMLINGRYGGDNQISAGEWIKVIK